MSNKIIEGLLDEVVEGCKADKLLTGRDVKAGRAMAEQRSASEIRAYCEAVPDPLEARPIDVWADRDRYAEVGVKARTDMLRLLESGMKLRAALLDAIATADEKAYDLGDQLQKRHETLLAATAWLAEEGSCKCES